MPAPRRGALARQGATLWPLRVPSARALEDRARFLFGCERSRRRGCAGRKMAAAVRQDLAQLMNSSGSHKDLAGK